MISLKNKKRLSQDEIQKLIYKEPEFDFDKKIPDSERAIIQRILKFDHELERKKEVKKIVREELKKKGIRQNDESEDEFDWMAFANEQISFEDETPAEDISSDDVWKNEINETKSVQDLNMRQSKISSFLYSLSNEEQDYNFIDRNEEDFFARAVNVGVRASRTPLSFPMVPERLSKKEIIEPICERDLTEREIDYDEKPQLNRPYSPPVINLRKKVHDKANIELQKLFETFPSTLPLEHRIQQSKMLMAKNCVSNLFKP